ncbi:delta-lactam-biosynthetic de-N-acetylase [Fictibacillus macauensis ZFHKF-1]|uniref:Delta-lactam-biosynthetic de-N-acetylase n=1 Tax=Fictibacillus macauensis ZFHKF-1 TaxID=1196324 RepID=I8UD07_9BACL|nr:delta-lactam-biosynthetic de-N-acetylase [Fictibacillus macauensis]EIT84683.1 delta-lactam-biosynthetic de-N-acetylase [Fictibacillus macauensis ZFHKF-1]
MKKWCKISVLAFVISMCSMQGVQAESTAPNVRHEWYFVKKGKEIPPTTDAKYEKLMKDYDGMFIGDPSKKEIYLTFDNGYENGYTDDVLNVLKEKKVPAAFFVTGHFINTCPDLIKRMASEGHIVGNHTNHHPDMTQINFERTQKELAYVKDQYEQLTGKKDMKYIRPPRGVFSERSIARSKELGYTHVFWSLAFFDWDVNRQKGWQYAYQSIMKQIHPGSILLLHTVSRDNAEALGKVIDDLKKQGYTFKSLDDFKASSK